MMNEYDSFPIFKKQIIFVLYDIINGHFSELEITLRINQRFCIFSTEFSCIILFFRMSLKKEKLLKIHFIKKICPVILIFFHNQTFNCYSFVFYR